MKKAIIFYTRDSFNNEGKFVVVCEQNNLNEVIKDNYKYCTDIYDYEIVNVYEEM